MALFRAGRRRSAAALLARPSSLSPTSLSSSPPPPPAAPPLLSLRRHAAHSSRSRSSTSSSSRWCCTCSTGGGARREYYGGPSFSCAARPFSSSAAAHEGGVPVVFDRAVKHKQRRASAQRHLNNHVNNNNKNDHNNSESASFLRAEIARRLHERIEDVSWEPRQGLRHVLDLGCAEGHVAELLLERGLRLQAAERARRRLGEDGSGNSSNSTPNSFSLREGRGATLTEEEQLAAFLADDDDDDAVVASAGEAGSAHPGSPLTLPALRTLFLMDSAEEFVLAARERCGGPAATGGGDAAASSGDTFAFGSVERPPRATPQIPGVLRADSEGSGAAAGADDAIAGAVDVRFVVGDEEALPFAENSLDMVVSNLSLHWCNDLPGVFAQVQRALRPDGMFIAAMFGEDTLHELRVAFALAEQERDGGVSPHVSPFVGVSDVGNLLTRAKFALPTVDHDQVVVHYADAFALMRDLQDMGENNAVAIRRNTPRDTLLAASAVYQSIFATPDDVDASSISPSGAGSPQPSPMVPPGALPATFEIVYLIAWKPSPTQQQPDARGSAVRSLKELGISSDEI